MLGINWVLLILELLGFLVLLIAWIILGIKALLQLRHRQMLWVMRLAWALIIVLIPFLGALAFFLTQPAKAIMPK
jgi:hypothetical protein